MVTTSNIPLPSYLQNAPPVILNVNDRAGISTFTKDARQQWGGKRVRDMLGSQSLPVPPEGYAGLATKQLAKLQQPQQRRPEPTQRYLDFTASSKLDQTNLEKRSTTRSTNKRYATDEDYKEVFDTRWRPDSRGRMSLYLSRKPGHAALEANPDKFDMITTFHRDRGYAGPPCKPDNLCNDGFLTGRLTASTSDVLKPLGNREPPFDNPDGPFECTKDKTHPSKIDHLDRLCIPKEIQEINSQPLKHVQSKGRMRVIRESSHILSNEEGLVGDDTIGWKRTAVPNVTRYQHHKKSSVCAPWTFGNL